MKIGSLKDSLVLFVATDNEVHIWVMIMNKKLAGNHHHHRDPSWVRKSCLQLSQSGNYL